MLLRSYVRGLACRCRSFGARLVLCLVAGAPAVAEMTWMYPRPLNSTAAVDGSLNDYDPYLATDGQGTWVAVWNAFVTSGGPYGDDMDVFSARSTDNGQTWSPPAPVNDWAVVDDLHDSTATVFTDGAGRWICVWGSWDSGSSSDIDLWYAISTNGLTWSAAELFNSDAATDALRDHDYRPQIVVGADGAWLAVWHKRVDSPPGDEGDIYFSTSPDRGATWTPPSLLHPSMAADGVDDRSVAIAADGAGHWVATWRGADLTTNGAWGTEGDIFVAISTNGVDFSAPAALNTDAAADTFIDNEGVVATDGAGRWIAVWYRTGAAGSDLDIVFSRSDDGGRSWTPPALLNANAAGDLGDDSRPRLVADRDGDWVAVWASTDTLGLPIGTERDLFFARSCDGGEHWTAPAVLNGNAAADPNGSLGSDWSHELFAGPDGHLLVAWYSADSLGNTIGFDRDILLATADFFVCGDADADGDVDLVDWAGLQDCLGPSSPPGAPCALYDFDLDDDVDLADFAHFAARLRGPAG